MIDAKETQGPIRLCGAAGTDPQAAERVRLRTIKKWGSDCDRLLMTVTRMGEVYVCSQSVDTASSQRSRLDWWSCVVAVAISGTDQPMVWGVPSVLLWQALVDADTPIVDVNRLGTLVKPGGSAIFWVDEGSDEFAPEGLYAHAFVTLPSSLCPRLEELIAPVLVDSYRSLVE